MFDFKRNCFICGQYCEVTPDPKNPGRKKNRGILCRTADRRKGNIFSLQFKRLELCL